MLSREFTKWVLIANIFSLPMAYFIMKNWLQNFVYHANITASVFIVSMILVVCSALITVIYQAVKAAIINPVECLKYE